MTDAADFRFALTKAPSIVEYAIRNVRSLLDDAPTRHLSRAHARAVLIVGAGPTLDLGRVREAAADGVSIWTVNTAARAVCSVVRPDVVVVRESLDVSGHLSDLRFLPRVVAMDLHAHPAVWAKARALGDLGAFFVPAALQSFALAEGLDVPAVYAGTASLTAAVALAVAGGAEWIGLEGVDLAYARDGRGYADGARYEARIARVDGTVATLSGGDAQRELAVASGQEPQPSVTDVHLVHARDGGAPLHAQGPWLSQIEWLETHARRYPGARLHRGEGLAELVGWAWPLRPPLRTTPTLDLTLATVPTERVEAVLADVARQVALQRSIADTIMAGGDPSIIAGLSRGAVLCDTHSAGQVMLAMAGRHGSLAERIADLYRAMGASADRLASLT